MAHGDAREGKWRGNWRMEWVASTLHTTSEHGVSSITTADAHTSAASSRLNWLPRRFKWTRTFRRKTKSVFLRVCHHISNAVYNTKACLANVSVWNETNIKPCSLVDRFVVLKGIGVSTFRLGLAVNPDHWHSRLLRNTDTHLNFSQSHTLRNNNINIHCFRNLKSQSPLPLGTSQTRWRSASLRLGDRNAVSEKFRKSGMLIST